MKSHGRFSSFDGTRISYRLWGDANELTPVVCCSGIACDDVYWTYLAPELSKQRLVVTWDYPWHGSSGPPGDRNEIGIPSLARHAQSLRSHLRIPRAALVGHSMGVQVILEHWRLFPEDTAALIAIGGPFAKTVGYLYGTSAGYYMLSLIEAFAKSRPDLMTLLWRGAVNPAIADPVGRAAGLIGHAPGDLMTHYFRHLQGLDVPGLLEMFRAGQAHTASDILEQIDVPVLIVHGTADVMSPFMLAEEMRDRIPRARLVGIEGGRHTLPIEDPERVNMEVTRFLRESVDPAVASKAGSGARAAGRAAAGAATRAEAPGAGAPRRPKRRTAPSRAAATPN